MEQNRHRLLHGEVKASAGKHKSWRNEKWLDRKEQWKGAGLCELELKIRMEGGLSGKMGGKERVDGDKKVKYKTAGHATKRQSQTIDGLRMGSAGDGKINPEEMVQEELKGMWRNETPVKGNREGNVIMSRLNKEESGGQLELSDYLVLLKSLRINLPNGVLNPKVIRLSQNADIVQRAQAIVKELENFKLQFNSTPRLGCREVKETLALKDKGKVLEITQMIFFEKQKDADEVLRAKWRENVSNTVCGFRLRDKYKTMAISTPAMYATTQTRCWRNLEVGDNLANISDGVTMKVHDIEKRDYCDESTLWTSSPCPKRFGKFFENLADEVECLKFFHELGETVKNKRVRYTRNSKVDFGFLSGRLDFLAEVTGSRANVKANGAESDKIVIECKGTTGDMVGKLFTKPKNGGRCAQLNETHQYCYQVQAYMYILNRVGKQTQAFTSDRAVMVIRHYHKNAQEPRDFYWNYLRKNEAVQQKIDELCVFCQEEVLACFLALLNLIFQKGT
ncbi:uncharacterized protein LOC127656363 [Xyrauchen texanus]|uniref:uncharacterized protein LOC127656363 n=1 Tax=Xyrauchen texanus TaxID=154827 RepID=UPI0022427A23|nr:uncharacterized protein LOC127656363 [Xyrauchen texanus]